MVATLLFVTEEVLKQPLANVFQLITCGIILKQLFASGSVNIVDIVLNIIYVTLDEWLLIESQIVQNLVYLTMKGLMEWKKQVKIKLTYMKELLKLWRFASASISHFVVKILIFACFVFK